MSLAVKDLSLEIQRFDPSRERRPHFERYAVPAREGMTVLDALLYAKERIDHSIALRFSCRMATCGSCGMKINGRPRLACETRVAHLRSGAITVEPMDNFPIVRDLVVDLGAFFLKHRSVSPRLVRRGDSAEQESPTGEYLMTPEELERVVQFTYCIKCGLCSSSCPTSSTDSLFLGPQALAQAYRYLKDVRDEAGEERIESVDTTHGVWRCHFSGTCSAVCPKGVDPALGIQLLKRHVLAAKRPRAEGARVFPNPNEGLVSP